MLTVTKSVKEKYPELLFGIMVMSQVQNPESHEELNQTKRELEDQLRIQYEGADRLSLRSEGPLHHYHNFYKKFKKSYYVQHQLESVVLKGKNLPEVAALVEAMFMAEIKNQLLTAGLDCDLIGSEVHIELSDGEKEFEVIGQRLSVPPKKDIIFADGTDILGSIICGPDHAHRITPSTSRAMFAIYGVPGITEEQMRAHFSDITHYVSIMSPDAIVELIEIA
jgi:DNA/RNA-binding domain of Phe-tRNA-synthetase-like protein